MAYKSELKGMNKLTGQEILSAPNDSVTVLMSTYNCAQYLTAAIMSILGQTHKEFEFLIVDDGSTDNTEEIIRGINDSRINYIKTEHSGLCSSLNFGMKSAANEIIVRMDADDISLPSRISELLDTAKKHPEFDVISSWYGVFINSNLKYIVKTSEKSEVISKNLLLYSEISHPGVMFRKSKILGLGGYKTEAGIDSFEDYALWLRIRNKVKFYNLQKVLLLYRFRNNSLSRENITRKYSLQYQIQSPYYLKERIAEFGVSTEHEELCYRGWREYFYGNTEKARSFWRKMGNGIFARPRIVMAYFVTFLPEGLFTLFKETRMRLRLNYLCNYFSSENMELRRALKIGLKDEVS